MTTITTRAGKGSPLTNAELDANFTNLNTDKLELGQAQSAGASNSLLFLNTSKVLTTGSALTFDGTNLGVGTTLPGYALDARGTSGVGIQIYETSTGNANRLIITQQGTVSTYNGTYATGSASHAWQIANSEQMRLTSTGLGVGVTNPAYKLDVQDPTGASIRARTTTSGNVSFIAQTVAGGTAYLQLSNAAGDHYIYGGNGGTQNIAFILGSSEGMRLTSTGLGIGTTSPAAKLEVSTSTSNEVARFTGSSVNGGYAAFRDATAVRLFLGFGNTLSSTATNTDAVIRYQSPNSLLFSSDGTERMRLDSSGNLGLGTASPAARLNVSGGSVYVQNSGTYSEPATIAGVIAFDTANGDLNISARSNSGNAFIRFFTSNGGTGAERMRLDSSGNLGLGVTPASWYSSYKAIQVGTFGALYSFPTNSGLSTNAYDDGVWKFSGTGWANRYIHLTGTGNHQWLTSTASGVAGGAITWTAAMTLNASGNLSVGTTAVDITGITINGSVGVANNSGLYARDNAGTSESLIYLTTGNNVSISAPTLSGSIQFNTRNASGLFQFFNAGTERMRLDSSGNLGLGVTPSASQTWAGGGVVQKIGLATTNAYTLIQAKAYAGALVATGGMLVLAKSRGSSVGTETATVSGDGLGFISFEGVNSSSGIAGSSYISGAQDGNAGATYVPGRIVLFTSDGTNAPSERMRLDSSGNLGLGVTPSAWGSNFKAFESAGNSAAILAGANVNGVSITSNTYNDNTNWIYKTTGVAARYAVNSSGHAWQIAASGTAGTAITFTQAMTLDASGNLGLGVTPSAWVSSSKAIQLPNGSSFANDGSSAAYVGQNWYKSGTGNTYISTGAASLFSVGAGSFIWYNAPSGTAGTAISFTQAMTLDASGNLGIGVTPSASLFTSSKTIQLGTYASFTQQTSATSDGYMLWGVRLTGDRTFQYSTTGDLVCAYRQWYGTHGWFTAAAGTAGNTVTFTQAMTLDSSGRLMVGTTSAAGILTVAQTGNSATTFTISNADLGASASTRIYFDTQGGASYIECRRNGGGLWLNVNAADRLNIDNGGNILNVSSGGLGYGTGSGGAVTQATSRTTGVTLDKTNGAITLVSAAGTTTWQTFTVTNNKVAATDTIIVNQKSGTDLYQIFVTNVAAGSFKISFATTGGTTTEQPVFNFAVIKAVTA